MPTDLYRILFGLEGRDEVVGGLDSATDGLNELEDASERTGEGFFSASLQADLLSRGISLLTERSTEFVGSIFQVGQEFARFQNILENQLGDAAEDAFKLIQTFAASTPLQVSEVTDAFIKLNSRGIEPTTQRLTQLSDLALARGKDIDQLTEAILDAQAFEFERLKEFGIRASKAGEEVTFTFNGVETTVAASGDAITDFLFSLGEVEGVAGSTAKIADSFEGSLSNVNDALDSLRVILFEIINAPATDFLSELGGSIRKGTSELEIFIESFKEFQRARRAESAQGGINLLGDSRFAIAARQQIESERRFQSGESLSELLTNRFTRGARREGLFEQLEDLQRRQIPLTTDQAKLLVEEIERAFGGASSQPLLEEFRAAQDEARTTQAEITNLNEEFEAQTADIASIRAGAREDAKEELLLTQQRLEAQEDGLEIADRAIDRQSELLRLAGQFNDLQLTFAQATARVRNEALNEREREFDARETSIREGLRNLEERGDTASNRLRRERLQEELEDLSIERQEASIEITAERQDIEDELAVTKLNTELNSIENQRLLNQLKLDQQQIELQIQQIALNRERRELQAQAELITDRQTEESSDARREARRLEAQAELTADPTGRNELVERARELRNQAAQAPEEDEDLIQLQSEIAQINRSQADIEGLLQNLSQSRLNADTAAQVSALAAQAGVAESEAEITGLRDAAAQLKEASQSINLDPSVSAEIGSELNSGLGDAVAPLVQTSAQELQIAQRQLTAAQNQDSSLGSIAGALSGLQSNVAALPAAIGAAVAARIPRPQPVDPRGQ